MDMEPGEDPAYSPLALGQELPTDAVIDIQGLWKRVQYLSGEYEEDMAQEERYERE